jgi:lipopolysaccharide transport system ATP-binding protein
MTAPIISVANLGKRYVISHRTSSGDGLRHAINDLLHRPFRWISADKSPQQPTTEEFWALKNVSFEINEGDVVGIIGHNGAGKSTLLKLLSRITEPSTGQIRLRGRVASLLEVGTGFHQDLTGRENIYLNGAILGMTRAEIRRKFDEIVAFAEVEKFLDTPVKRYSSGMYVRLAFAVAAHLEPEILVVDEVLAVGDTAFQRKCLGKMQDVSRTEGRTVLFVSHNMGAILQLTKRAVVLDGGQLAFSGPTAEAVDAYSAQLSDTAMLSYDVEHVRRQFPGTGEVRFISFRFERTSPIFAFSESLGFVARLRALKQLSRFRMSMTVFGADGTPVGSSFGREHDWPPDCEILDVRLRLDRLRLGPGHYYCALAVGRGDHKTGPVFDVVVDSLHFEVQAEEGEDGTAVPWERGWGPTVFEELCMSSSVIVQNTQAMNIGH